MAVLHRAGETIDGLEQRLTGSFVIGCHESLGAYFLPDLLERVLTDAPDIAITLHNDSSSSVLDAVVGRKVHFGIVVNPQAQPDVVVTALFRDAIDVFVAAADGEPGPEDAAAYYDAPGARFADLDEARAYFEDHPLVYPSRVRECATLVERLAAQGFSPTRRLDCGDFGLVKSLALAGIGPALLPRRIAAHRSPHQLRRLHHELPVFEDAIHLVFRADLHRTRATDYLKDELVRCGSSMPQELEIVAHRFAAGLAGDPRVARAATEQPRVGPSTEIGSLTQVALHRRDRSAPKRKRRRSAPGGPRYGPIRFGARVVLAACGRPSMSCEGGCNRVGARSSFETGFGFPRRNPPFSRLET